MADVSASRPDQTTRSQITEAREELARLNRELAIARRRLELTLDAAGASGTWEWHIPERRLVADARFAALTGQDPIALSEGVATGQFFTGIYPDDVKRVRLAVAGILAGAEVFSREYRLLQEDGGFRWVHARGHAVFDENDLPVRFVGTLVDITAQKLSQEQLRIAQVAGGIGTFEHVAGFGTVSVSAQFCRLFGLHPTKVLPISTLNSLIHPDDPPVIDPASEYALSDHPDVEFRVRRADDGAERWLARRGEYIDDPKSLGRCYVGVIYDVTAAKQAEESLRKANELLAERARENARERNRVWQNARDPLVVVRSDGTLIDVNPAWSDILGHGPEESVGKSIFAYVFKDDVELLRAGLARAAEAAHADFEVRHLRNDGTLRSISWMTSHEGPTVYAYGRDVTFANRQAQMLRETEAQLRQSQKMEAVGQLTGGIAHDFNNMLTGVIASLAIVKRRILARKFDDVDRFMDAATTSAERAAALTHRLLAFSRRQPLDRRPVDVNALISSIEYLLRRTLGEQILLHTRLDPTISPAVTDANQLENAVLNLVINARDAMPEGGTLIIETSCVTLMEEERIGDLAPGDYVVIGVSDTGIGMSENTIAKAFDPFFTTKPIGQGTGLGLSMIYGFAQQSGGHVQIDSELGEGTTIKLYLPNGNETSSRPGTEAKSDSLVPRGEGEAVLIVEDDDAVRMLVLEVLKELGYRGLEATNAQAAIPIIESGARIDLLISDVGLPGLNGRQLAEIALSCRPGLKVLFITGYAAKAASRAEFLGPGMQMITKPFAIDDLAHKIREIITSQ